MVLPTQGRKYWYAFTIGISTIHGTTDTMPEVPEGSKWRTREGGSEWEPIKFFSKEIEAPTRWTRLPTHVSDSTIQVGQDHVATGVLLILGTNKQPSEPELTNMHNGNLHGLLPVLHRSDRWPALVRLVGRPVRPVATAAAQQMFQRASVTSLGPGIKTPQNTTCTEEEPYTKPSKATPN
jgi:hypothetical protein